MKIKKDNEDELEFDKLEIIDKNATMNKLNFSKFEKRNSKSFPNFKPGKPINFGKMSQSQLFSSTTANIISKKKYEKNKI